jgi:serine protease Do
VTDERQQARGPRLIVAAGIVAAAILGGIVGAALAPRSHGSAEHAIAPVIRIERTAPPTFSVADLVEKTCPAVVSIETTESASAAAKVAKAATAVARPGLTGFFVASDGRILAPGADLPDNGAVAVLLSDGRRFGATRAGFDPVSGLAVLKVDGSDFPTLSLADQSFARVGDLGIALATPNGSGCLAAPAMVSSDFVVEGGGSRSYVRFTPALGADMAGAPILDQEGRVVGIAGIGSDTNAALPAAIAAPVVSALLRSGAPAPDRAGMEVSDITPAVAARLGDPRQRGAFVSLIAGGSPADQAGLMAGDVVIAAAGSPIASASELARALDGASGATSLDVVRRGTAITITLKLSPRTE